MPRDRKVRHAMERRYGDGTLVRQIRDRGATQPRRGGFRSEHHLRVMKARKQHAWHRTDQEHGPPAMAHVVRSRHREEKEYGGRC